MNPDRTALAAIWPPTAAVAREIGHKQMSPMKAIREKCLDCSCGQPSEAKACESVKCALWPFRAGKHPYTSSKLESSLLGADFTEENGSATAATVPSLGPNFPERKKDEDA